MKFLLMLQPLILCILCQILIEISSIISGHFSKVLAGVVIYYHTGEVYEVSIDIKDAVLGT